MIMIMIINTARGPHVQEPHSLRPRLLLLLPAVRRRHRHRRRRRRSGRREAGLRTPLHRGPAQQHRGDHGDHGDHSDHGDHGDHIDHGDHGDLGDLGDHGDHGSRSTVTGERARRRLRATARCRTPPKGSRRSGRRVTAAGAAGHGGGPGRASVAGDGVGDGPDNC